MLLLNGHLSFAQLRAHVDAGESVLQHDKGFNALHAALFGIIDLREKLTYMMGAGADVNQVLEEGHQSTPLHLSLANEEYDESVLFIEIAGVSIDYSVLDSERKTTLILAAKMNATMTALAVLKAITQKHTYEETQTIINLQDRYGFSALHYACLYGSEVLARALLDAGACSNILNKGGNTPVECVVLGEGVIRQALDSIEINPDRDEKAALNEIRDRHGQHLMSLQSRAEGKKYVFLSKKSATSSLFNFLKKDVMDHAASKLASKPVMMSKSDKVLIRNHVSQFTGVSLVQSCVKATQALKMTLFERGYVTAWLLYQESAAGNQAAVALMLQSGEGRRVVNDAYDSTCLYTALHAAACHGHIGMCRLLIANGATVDCKDSCEETPLHMALQKKQFALAKELVRLGASLSCRNRHGDNALAMLTTLNKSELKQKLIAISREAPGQENEAPEGNVNYGLSCL
jgi:hypothetical protein